jgi:hypothetical protein
MDNAIEAYGLLKRFGATTALDQRAQDGDAQVPGHAPILPRPGPLPSPTRCRCRWSASWGAG